MSKRQFGQDNYDTTKERDIDFPRESVAAHEGPTPVLGARPKLCECGHVQSLHFGRCMACQCTGLRVTA